MWAKTKVGDVTCPFCRSKWEGDADMVSRVKRDQGVQSEGYVNVASQLGISTVRGMLDLRIPSIDRTYQLLTFEPQRYKHVLRLV